MARAVREGTGYGSGIAKDLGDAIESALKEAETDAMKRALMTFGNPFGLALYDKTQASVSDPREAEQAQERDELLRLIRGSNDMHALTTLGGSPRLTGFSQNAPAPMVQQVRTAYADRKRAIENQDARAA